MLTKEEALQHAERLGIEGYETMPWNELNSTVSKALAEERKGSNVSQAELNDLERRLAEAEARNREYAVKYENRDDGHAPTREELHNNPIIIAPEIAGNIGHGPKYPKYMFEEEVNNDVLLGEDEFEPGQNPDLTPGSYKAGGHHNQGYTNRKVVAQTAGPRENPGQIWNPEELFMTVKYRGQDHYRWAHVLSVLSTVEGGLYLDKYYDEIYGSKTKASKVKCNGGLLCIEKSFVNKIIREIEEEERKKLITQKREEEFLKDKGSKNE